MPKAKRKPKPLHSFPVTFKKYGKKYTVEVKFFKNNLILNRYYNYEVVATSKEPIEIYAGAIFEYPTKENKNLIGQIVFSMENLQPSLISHEAIHMVFCYFEKEHGLNFKKRRKEETFCGVQEHIVNAVYDYIQKHDIRYELVPKWFANAALPKAA